MLVWQSPQQIHINSQEKNKIQFAAPAMNVSSLSAFILPCNSHYPGNKCFLTNGTQLTRNITNLALSVYIK